MTSVLFFLVLLLLVCNCNYNISPFIFHTLPYTHLHASSNTWPLFRNEELLHDCLCY